MPLSVSWQVPVTCVHLFCPVLHAALPILCREPSDGSAGCLRAEDAVYRDVDLVYEKDAREDE